MDTEWLLSTLFDASLLSLEPPHTAALFLAPFKKEKIGRFDSASETIS